MRLASYDFFDTLVTRLTRKPADVFCLLGASEVVRFRWRIASIIPFHIWRRQAERYARWLSPREDIELIEIYRVLGWIIYRPSQVLRLEVALEIAVTLPIPDMLEQLKKQHVSNTPCCIVSDTYLPATVVRKIARKHSANAPLFVSSEIGLTKTTGNLFDHVAKIHQVPLSAIHHHGDNSISDYAVPLGLGMHASLIPVKPGSASVCMLDVLKCPKEDDPHYEMGFRVAGPSAFVMATSLIEYITEKAPPNIVFAARDMHLILYAFRRLSKYRATSYCRISRSAVYRAQWHVTRDSTHWFEKVSSGAEFFARLGLDCPPDLTRLIPSKNKHRFIDALSASKFPADCEHEFYVIRDYLKAQDLQPGTLFVDLGWRGSIQDAINQILAPDKPIDGWYFGINSAQANKYGLYFVGSSPAKRFHRVLQAVAFFEFIFTEAVPSLSRIIRNENSYEFIPTQDEYSEQIEARARITEGAKAYIDIMCSLHQAARFKSKDLFLSLDHLYDCYLLSPPKHWVNKLDSVTHSAGFGGSGASPLIGDNSGTLRGFLNASWQGAYLKIHEDSKWAPILNILHHHLAFIAYTFLKQVSRRLKALQTHWQRE